MIPPLTTSGYLPPFIGDTPTASAGMAPFRTTIVTLGMAFATTPARKDTFRGLLRLREMMRSEGIANGFQWIDGSYVEACEDLRGRAPNDIDVVTFFRRPPQHSTDDAWKAFQPIWTAQFDRTKIRQDTFCDAYFVDLHLPARVLVGRVRYWFGLLSHQRDNGVWKGLLEVPLTLDDRDAWNWLASVEKRP